MQQPPASSQAGASDRRARWAILLVTLSVFAGMLALLRQIPNLYDTDSYFHLAVAREYWDQGIRGGLPWARQSVMAAGFGDKELLFHLLLIPFVKLGGTAGGKLAIAVFASLLALQIARLAVRALGVLGALVPLWLFLTAADLVNRLLRLRPETLSVLLLLIAVELAAARRYRLLALLALLFTYTHTAWHTLPLLCALRFLQLGLRERHWDWRLVAHPLAGCGVALVIHPHFPHNLLVWWMQNVDHFLIPLPDAGAEFSPNAIRYAFELNAGWWLGLLLLWGARTPGRDATEQEGRMAGFLGLGTFVFALLFALISRFATYLVPFATLALLFELRRRGRTVSAWVALPWRGRLPLAAGFALLLLSVPLGVSSMRDALTAAGAFERGREGDAARLGRDIPEGARVAATWGEADYYAYWAPQARYLNVLDPVFMARWRPRVYEISLAVFDGSEPDVPLTVATDLDSDSVVLMQAERRTVGQRLMADPRVRWSQRGIDSLFTIGAGNNRGFLLDWQTAPLPLGASSPTAAMVPYPRAADERAQALEGFVDFRRLSGGDPCRVFAHEVDVAEPTTRSYEFAPYGRGVLSCDGAPVVGVQSDPRAILGRGVILSLRLARGHHTLSVQTCREGRFGGFYLLER